MGRADPNRVNRGGSFNNPATNARSANRNNNDPENRNNNLGVRPSKVSHRPIAAATPACPAARRAVPGIPRPISRSGAAAAAGRIALDRRGS